MGDRLQGKIALVTGAARGQGRAHCVRLAEEGADVIALDVCAAVPTAAYPAATEADLEETARLVRQTGRRVVPDVADIRDGEALQATVDQATARLGGLDVVVANAAIATFAQGKDLTPEMWQTTIDVNLTGAWNTAQAVRPILEEQGRGGSIVFTGSVLSAKGAPNLAHYSAAKHGVLGLARSLAIELGPLGIRVNMVLPGTVRTVMYLNDRVLRLHRPDLEDPTEADMADITRSKTLLGVPGVEPEDIANAVLWLASDESRYVTGIVIPVDGGLLQK